MKLKYVGVKLDGETAFSGETKITWRPGDEHEVPDSIARKMLGHPDVFALADGLEGQGSADVVVIDQKITLPNTEGEIDLAVLSVDELKTLALSADVKVHHAAGKEKIIAALMAAYPKAE
jgi:hypothetical protein